MTRKEIKTAYPDLTPTQRAALRKAQTKAQTQATQARRVAVGKPAKGKRHYSTRSKPRYTIAHTSSASRIVANGGFYERETAGQGVA